MWSLTPVQLILPIVLLIIVSAQRQETACDLVPVKDAFRTDKYLLYGLTTDCRLFFATQVPEGFNIGAYSDLNFAFFEEPTEQFDCSNTLLRPIRDSKGRLRLLIVFKVGDTVYEKVRDFPAFNDGEWYQAADASDRIYECRVNSTEKCKAKGQFIRALKQSPNSKVLGFVDDTGSEFDLLDPIYFYKDFYYQYPINLRGFNMMPDGKLSFVNVNLTQDQWKMSYSAMDNRVIFKKLLTDPYADYLYFTTSTMFYRTPLSNVKNINILQQTLAPFQEWSMDISDNDDYRELSFSIVDNEMISLKYSTPSKSSANIVVQHIYLISENNQGISGEKCIGQLGSQFVNSDNSSLSFNSLMNFQVSALLFDDYDEVMTRKPLSNEPAYSIIFKRPQTDTVTKNPFLQ